MQTTRDPEMNPTNLSATAPAAAQPQDDKTASSWVNEVSGLVSPPDVCIKVFDLIESQNPSAATIGEVVSRDPNLSLRLLKIVNSSYYNFSSKIDTVSRAIAVIGISELYSMVIAITAVKTFSHIPHNVVNMDTFWRHSLYTAVISRLLAKRLNVLHPERLFVAGLLHDIGSLILYHRAPETAKELLIQSEGDEEALHQAENEAFGFSHAAIGALLMKLWHLPDPICDAVANHHQPSVAKQGTMETAIIHMANALANHTEIGAFCELPMTELTIDAACWPQLGIKPDDLDQETLLEEAGQQFADMISIFY
ncbi:MAG TPA: HDOD domain-containing protein [Gammaproteobacteria bacterium]|nr:HDOD domain-containing protein [Gammaproteobacteria bacterium]